MRDALAEKLLATVLGWSAAEVARLEAAVPAEAAAGSRYDAHQMKMLDSER